MSKSLLGQPIPAYYALGVSDPTDTRIQLPHGVLTADGAAVEFTVTPTNDVAELVRRIKMNLARTQQIIAPVGTLSLEPHFPIAFEYIDRLNTDFGKQCSLQILGCAPDECVYFDLELPDRPDPRAYPWRTSGGHIHIQVGTSLLEDRAALCYTVAALDSVLGTASGYLCTSQQAADRMRLYGSAGMVRTNSVLGTVEYRTLPAQALIQTEILATHMFTAAQEVCGLMHDIYMSMSQPEAIREFEKLFGSYGEIRNSVVPAINQHDVDACRRVQESVGNRLSEYATITAVIDKLQAYVMPNDFDLHWEF